MGFRKPAHLIKPLRGLRRDEIRASTLFCNDLANSFATIEAKLTHKNGSPCEIMSGRHLRSTAQQHRGEVVRTCVSKVLVRR